MDPLYNPLGTRPIQMGREMSMEPYPNRQFGFIDDPGRQSGFGSVPTCTRTRSDGPDPLLTLSLAARSERFICHFGQYGSTWMSNMIFLCRHTIVIPRLPCLIKMAKAVSSTVELVNSVTSDTVNSFNLAM